MDNQNQQQPIVGRKEDVARKGGGGVVSKVIIGVLSVAVLALGGALAMVLIDKNDKETGGNKESNLSDNSGSGVVDDNEDEDKSGEVTSSDPLEPFYNVLASEGFNVNKVELVDLEESNIKNSSITPYQTIQGNIGFCDENRENCDGGAAVHFWREGAEDDWHFGFMTQSILDCADYIGGFVGRKAPKAFAGDQCLDVDGKTVTLKDAYTGISEL
ncbi:MAG: hypothetical protein LBQ02_03080 [Candidatus Nomurabacteria bacterium]|jgi:hypothetical protein|nr:hypothetical protein [Candidatus Nomurabacteria bacterium]